MKRMCVAPLCIAVLIARHAGAQENCNRQNSTLCPRIAQAQPVGNQGEIQPGSTGANDLHADHRMEPQAKSEAAAPDSQAQSDSTSASPPAEKEAVAILELGAEPTRSLSGGGWTLSPTVAAEVTPIENWLELEFGVTPTFTHRSTEWDTDLLFKKPWTLSKKVEFMFGVGPEWIHVRENRITTNSVAGEIALDFMFWPSAKRRFGWYLEPAYDYTFGRSHDQAIGISIGLLISVR